MKKHALALAVGLVSSLPVAAVAAPTIYGQFMVSLDKKSDYPALTPRAIIGDTRALLPGVPPAPPAPAGAVLFDDAWAVESNSSRIGIRGSEELFNKDMSVIYQYETQADIDGDGPTFTTRNAFLGLDTKASKIFAGNYDSLTKLADGDIDQFDYTAADMRGTFLGQHRNANTLNWESKDMSGMVFRVQLAPGEGDTAGMAPNPVDEKDGLADTLGASVTFQQDTLFAAFAFEQSYAEVVDPTATAPTLGLDTQLIRGSVGVSMDGGLELGAILELFELDPDQPGARKADGRSLLVSGKIAANDRLAFKAQLGMLDSSDLDTEITTITLGTDYMLGKQTTAYALVSLSDVEIEPAPLVKIDESGNVISLGLKHKF